jgi:hypothetical protein
VSVYITKTVILTVTGGRIDQNDYGQLSRKDAARIKKERNTTVNLSGTA